ncbi:MAG: hypothetical protein H0V69_11390 [Acidimicrobiia bacterium]|nr:hypothetical protein [Acidimicrobiia bacterium]
METTPKPIPPGVPLDFNTNCSWLDHSGGRIEHELRRATADRGDEN